MSFTQEIRAKIIADCYRAWLPSNTEVLDVGCGNGVVSQGIAKSLGVTVRGTDILDYRKTDLPFTWMEASNRLPFAAGAFEYVMINDVLHHMQDQVAVLNEARRVAKCVLVFEDCDSWLLRGADVMLNRLYCSKMPCPLTFRSKSEWEKLFTEQNFASVFCAPRYPFWYPFRHMAFKLT